MYLSASGKFEPNRVKDGGEAFLASLIGNGVKVNESVALRLMKQEVGEDGLTTTSFMEKIANSFFRNSYFTTMTANEVVKQGTEYYERFQ